MPALTEDQAALVAAVPKQAVRCYLAARRYARLGFLVRGIEGTRKNGTVPTDRWQQKSFPSPEPLGDMSRWPWIGVTGLWVRVPDCWVVLDHDNELSRDYWLARLGPVADKAAVERSPSGSEHWWFRLAQDVTGQKWSNPRKCDARFDIQSVRNGGVVAPPSAHHKGGFRQWTRPLDQARELTASEARLLHRHVPQHELLRNLAEPPGRGEYHNWMLSVAGSLARVHGDHEAFAEAARRIEARYMSDHDPADTAAIVRDIWQSEHGSLLDEAPASYESPGAEEDDEEDQDEPYPLLPDQFWESPGHPFLAHVRLAARARRVSPDATLVACLARVAALLHWRHQLPPIIGGWTSLDLLVAVIAEPSFGKGGAMSVAEELVPGCNKEDGLLVRTVSFGSTEGMAGAYFDMREEEDEKGDVHMVEGRVYNGVLFSCDEGSSYQALAQRTGQTTPETIRSMFKGERLGNSYTGRSKKYQVPAMHYRAAVVVAFQPVHARALLGEWDAGTPQRFIWTSARDPGMLREKPEWPGPLKWRPPAADRELDPIRECYRLPIQVAASVSDEIDSKHVAKHLGEWDPGRYDGHRYLVAEKLAALLGALRTGYPIVSREDWRLANVLMGVSDAVRNRMLGDIRTQQSEQEEASHGKAARRAAAVRSAEVEAEADIERVAGVLARACRRNPGETTRSLIKRTASRDRRLAEVALKRAESLGLVAQQDDGTWQPGASSDSQ
ncbi:MAG: bifunctional DNA primase/polymerase [Trebonia sp.]